MVFVQSADQGISVYPPSINDHFAPQGRFWGCFGCILYSPLIIDHLANKGGGIHGYPLISESVWHKITSAEFHWKIQYFDILNTFLIHRFDVKEASDGKKIINRLGHECGAPEWM